MTNLFICLLQPPQPISDRIVHGLAPLWEADTVEAFVDRGPEYFGLVQSMEGLFREFMH